MYDEIKTHEIDTLSSEVCIGMITSDPDYEVLATRIVASNIQKRASNNFHIAMRKLHKAGIVTHEVLEVSSKVKDNIEHERDFDFGYFGLKLLKKGIFKKLTVILLKHLSIYTCAYPLVFTVTILIAF